MKPEIEKYYEIIGQKLGELIPEEYKNVWVTARGDIGTVELSIYYKNKNDVIKSIDPGMGIGK